MDNAKTEQKSPYKMTKRKRVRSLQNQWEKKSKMASKVSVIEIYNEC
jgi:hypothetical protein